MTVAWNDLRRDRLDCEAQLGRDMFFHARIDIGERADRAGNRAGRDLGLGRDEARTATAELGIGLRHLKAEGDRLGMNAMATADSRRHLMLKGAPLDRFEERVDICNEQVARSRQLH